MKIYIKSITLLVVASLFSLTSFSQFLNLEDAKKIKKSHVILALTDSESINDELRKMVKEFWTLTEIAEELPLAKAVEKIKPDGSVTIIMLGRDKSTNWSDEGNGWETKRSASSPYIGINTKSKKEANLQQHIQGFNSAQFAFGLSSIQDMINTMIDGNLASNAKVMAVYKKRANIIKQTTLLIDESSLGKKTTNEVIKSAYPNKYSIVSHEEWVEAITSKKEGYCYINSVPVPVGDQIVYMTYVLTTDKNQTLGIFRSTGGTETTKSKLGKVAGL